MMVLNFIEKLKLKKKQHGNNLQGKCPYCGDSPKENHFGILLSEPIVFNCFRCHTSGTIYKLSRDFGLDLYSLIYNLNLYKNNNYNSNNIPSINYKYIKIEFCPDNIKYLDYIHKRKIDNNYKLDNLYIHPKKIDYIFFYLDNKFIGRNIYNNNPRYLTYNNNNILFNSFVKKEETFYKIETIYNKNKDNDRNRNRDRDKNIDIGKDEDRERDSDIGDIYITEGIFDLYSIFEYNYNKNRNIIVYAILSNILNKDLCDDIIYNIKINKSIKNIYISLDKDINIYNEQKIINRILYIANNIPEDINIYNIIYTGVEKDINELLINNKQLEYEKVNFNQLLQKYYK